MHASGRVELFSSVVMRCYIFVAMSILVETFVYVCTIVLIAKELLYRSPGMMVYREVLAQLVPKIREWDLSQNICALRAASFASDADVLLIFERAVSDFGGLCLRKEGR